MGIYAISGAASGIGASVADRLMRDGHQIIGVDVQPTEVVADLGTSAGRGLVAKRVAQLSSGTLDGVVSGAGLGPLSSPEPILRVNYFGALAMLDDLMPLLANGKDPAAVAISSFGAIVPDFRPDITVTECLDACMNGDEEAAVASVAGRSGFEAYCVSKRALAFKVREYAERWGKAGIRLNAIAPGATDTPMRQEMLKTSEATPVISEMPIPLGQPAKAVEIASVICFLLSTEACYVHGAVIHADGGTDSIVRPRHL